MSSFLSHPIDAPWASIATVRDLLAMCACYAVIAALACLLALPAA